MRKWFCGWAGANDHRKHLRQVDYASLADQERHQPRALTR